MMRKITSGVLTVVLCVFWANASARFVSADPVKADPKTGTNFNRYWYANNNPYKFTDPDGRQSRELQYIYKQSGAQPPSGGKGPNLIAWGTVEFLCGFCDLNYRAPPGSGALQPIFTPMETGVASAGATAGKVVFVIAKDPKALFLAGSLLTGDSDVAEALAAAAARKTESELSVATRAQVPQTPRPTGSPPPNPKPPSPSNGTNPSPPQSPPPPPPKANKVE